jgi:tRNA (guanine-N7-)-methyltransferase
MFYLATPQTFRSHTMSQKLQSRVDEIAKGIVGSNHSQHFTSNVCGPCASPRISWSSLPQSVDPVAGGKIGRTTNHRAERKRFQTESIFQILKAFADTAGDAPIRVVDFGCGSGNFSLALASLLPQWSFVLVDRNAVACELAAKRAAEAGLRNVRTHVSAIENFIEEFDLAISLHACGSASDCVQLQCFQRSAAYIMCPCCIGKLRHGINVSKLTDDDSASTELSYPRSEWLASKVSTDDFLLLAAAADHNARSDEGETAPNLAKIVIELDRDHSAKENRFTTVVTTLYPLISSSKHHVLIGVPPADTLNGKRWLPSLDVLKRQASTNAEHASMHSEESLFQEVAPPATMTLPAYLLDPKVAPTVSSEGTARNCQYFVRRKKRLCHAAACEGSDLCSRHQPDALALERDRVQKEKNAFLEAQKAKDEAPNGDDQSIASSLDKKRGSARTRISSSQRRMKNPLSIQQQKSVELPDWGHVFSDPTLPVHIDIGCARGKMLQQMARLTSSSTTTKHQCNHIGIEIREDLVKEANDWVQQNQVGNLYFIACNINVCIGDILDSLCQVPGSPACTHISIQFPDPWSRVKHRKRRILQPDLVAAISKFMASGSQLYISSDVPDVVEDASIVTQSGFRIFSSDDAASQRFWWTAPIGETGALAQNPLPLPSEREIVCEATWRKVYRGLFVKC